MLTLIVFFTFAGFFLLYNTSRKAVLGRSLLPEVWAQQNPVPAKVLACLLMGIALTLSIGQLGTGSGIFGFLVVLMTVASCTILIAPLRYISYKVLTAIFLLSMFAEIFI